jgi:hypothetical protein
MKQVAAQQGENHERDERRACGGNTDERH